MALRYASIAMIGLAGALVMTAFAPWVPFVRHAPLLAMVASACMLCVPSSLRATVLSCGFVLLVDSLAAEVMGVRPLLFLLAGMVLAPIAHRFHAERSFGSALTISVLYAAVDRILTPLIVSGVPDRAVFPSVLAASAIALVWALGTAVLLFRILERRFTTGYALRLP